MLSLEFYRKKISERMTKSYKFLLFGIGTAATLAVFTYLSLDLLHQNPEEDLIRRLEVESKKHTTGREWKKGGMFGS